MNFCEKEKQESWDYGKNRCAQRDTASYLVTLLCIDAQTCNIPSQHIYVFLSLWVFNLSSDVYSYGYNYIYPQDSFTIHGNKECSEKAKMKNRINWTGMFCNISEST